jgi:hypothetical protein
MEMSGQLHAPVALPPGKEPLVPYGLRGWVGPRAILDAAMKRNIPSPRLESNPWTLIVQPVASRYSDWAYPALCMREYMWNLKFSVTECSGDFSGNSCANNVLKSAVSETFSLLQCEDTSNKLSSETLVSTLITTRCHNQEDRDLNSFLFRSEIGMIFLCFYRPNPFTFMQATMASSLSKPL